MQQTMNVGIKILMLACGLPFCNADHFEFLVEHIALHPSHYCSLFKVIYNL